jgi:hypothetical protein
MLVLVGLVLRQRYYGDLAQTARYPFDRVV